jgi:hypothetical protein
MFQVREVLYMSVIFIAIIACSQSIYKTPSGKKYHFGSCRMVENVWEKITPEIALELRMEPCKICKPDLIHLKPSTENKAIGKAYLFSVKVLLGSTRCKHYTHIANGYCFQHQPG